MLRWGDIWVPDCVISSTEPVLQVLSDLLVTADAELQNASRTVIGDVQAQVVPYLFRKWQCGNDVEAHRQSSETADMCERAANLCAWCFCHEVVKE